MAAAVVAAAIVAVFDPVKKRPRLFRQIALPFGASAAVLAFNWVAAALCHFLAKLLYIGASNFYDDFTIIERARLAAHTTRIVDRFFSLLGWQTKDMPPFAPRAF